MAGNLEQLSTDALQDKLRAAQAVQRTVFGIFTVIVLAWLVLGYWRTNTPVFISTLVVAIGAGIAVSTGPRSVRAELARRASAPTT